MSEEGFYPERFMPFSYYSMDGSSLVCIIVLRFLPFFSITFILLTWWFCKSKSYHAASLLKVFLMTCHPSRSPAFPFKL